MRLLGRVCCLLTLVILFSTAFAKEPEGGALSVTVKEGQGVREVAETYLGDVSRWEEILKLNDLKETDSVTAGMLLQVPVTDLSKAVHAIDQADVLIRQAIELGALILAPAEVDSAAGLLDEARDQRSNEALTVALEQATSAQTIAGAAIQVCQQKKDDSSLAAILYRIERVESKTAEDIVWNTAQQYGALKPGDQLRTFHGAFAELRFRDGTLLQLGQNSQITFITQAEDETDSSRQIIVQLDEGSISVSGGSTSIDHAGPTIKTEEATISASAAHFLVSHTPKKTAISCMEGTLQVQSGDASVALNTGKGVVARGIGVLDPVRSLAVQPGLDQPADGATAYTETESLSWKAADGAGQYLVETASDSAFRNVTGVYSGLQLTEMTLEELRDCELYWRVSGVDMDGLRGISSQPRLLIVQIDHTPPFLALHSPKDGIIVNESPITFTGATEPGMQVFIKGQPAEVDSEGAFTGEVSILDGANDIRVLVIDPAGNETEKTVTVTFFANETMSLTMEAGIHAIGQNTFLSQSPRVTLYGETNPSATIEVTSRQSDFKGRSLANDEGSFLLNVTAKEPTEVFDILVTSLSGLTLADSFVVTVDTLPPVITLDEEPLQTRNNKELTLNGTVQGGVSLRVNGEGVSLDEAGRFAATVELDSGANVISLEAFDEARNPAVRHLNIELDTEPPAMIRALVDPLHVTGGELVRVTVKVEDPTGMHEAAPFILQIDEFRYTGALKLSKQYNDYRGRIRIPAGVEGDVRLVLVRIEDYNGNRRDYKY